jgi:hypothetical protein
MAAHFAATAFTLSTGASAIRSLIKAADWLPHRSAAGAIFA